MKIYYYPKRYVYRCQKINATFRSQKLNRVNCVKCSVLIKKYNVTVMCDEMSP